jgi:SAM-dependent methyltransferase
MSTTQASFTGSIPAKYDHYLGPLLFEPYAVDLVSRIQPDRIFSVLEVACGTGRVTHHLHRHFSPKVKITATDLNPDMLQVAQSRVPHESIDWLPANMLALPFEDETFDAAVCQFGIMFVPDKAKAFREISRVLKKGGVLYFNTWDKIENNGVAHIASQVVTRYFDNSPPQFYTIPFSMYQSDQLESLSLGNGFSGVKVDFVRKEGRGPAHDAAKGFVEGNPIYIEILEKDPDAVETITELIRKEISSTFGGDPITSPMHAWVCEARK